MARLEKHHQELTNGVGKCSVPMWQCGIPSGFCDEPAYGKQTPRYLAGFKYLNPTFHAPAFASGLACPAHGGPEPDRISKLATLNPGELIDEFCRATMTADYRFPNEEPHKSNINFHIAVKAELLRRLVR